MAASKGGALTLTRTLPQRHPPSQGSVQSVSSHSGSIRCI